MILTVPGFSGGQDNAVITADSEAPNPREMYMKFPAARPEGQDLNVRVLAFPLNDRFPETPEPLVADQMKEEASIESARKGVMAKRANQHFA